MTPFLTILISYAKSKYKSVKSEKAIIKKSTKVVGQIISHTFRGIKCNNSPKKGKGEGAYPSLSCTASRDREREIIDFRRRSVCPLSKP